MLAELILDGLPSATYLGQDGSALMLEHSG